MEKTPTPEEARSLIAKFRRMLPGTDYIETDAGRKIEFDEMTDIEAIEAAMMLRIKTPCSNRPSPAF